MAYTPTQDLFLELLAARHRLGHGIWTLDSRHRRTAESLEAMGLVGWKHGVVEHTILAWLTDEGKAQQMSPTYVPPLLGGEP